MYSGQTRAVLARKKRAGVAPQTLLREKRMSDLAWQMNIANIKLNGYRENNDAAKTRLERLHNEAKAEFDRLKFEIEIENAPKEYGVYLG